ncbi:DUF2142 domain-containing protein [Candidatus Saccharibacteria bacterium]|nr:DUF2142 domain-containing protein [Candidatus Saccharibacteria bacterium]
MNKCREWIKGLLKNKNFYFCVFFIIANLFFTKQILNDEGMGGIVFVIVALIELVIEVLSIWVIVRMRKRGVPIEKQFLFLALILGTLFIVILPPGQSPDEVTHFKRAYGISDGIFLPVEIEGTGGRVGSDIPVGTDVLSSVPKHGTYFKIADRIDDGIEQKTPQVYTSAALYSFICYIPQVLASLVGKILNFSVLGTAYLMEIFNYAFWVVLVFYAIRLIPKFKSIVLFIALLPITIQEATSMSPDALTIGLCLFFVSYILYLAYGKKRILEKQDYIILAVCSIIVGFCKIVYLPLVLLLLLIPKERFKSNKQRWVFLGTLIAFVAIINAVWLLVSSRYLIEYRSGVNSKEQLIGILKNPSGYFITIFRSINANSYLWLSNMLGMTLGSFRFNLPAILFFVSFAIMVLLFGQRIESLKMKKFDRWIIAFVLFVIFALILTSLYMQWTPYGDEIIDGVQGRYFLPILILTPIMISRTEIRRKYPVLISDQVVLHYSLFINVISIITIFAQNA